jgi:hypothetical protein
MARKVTLRTRLRRGDIVRIQGSVVLGIVVRREVFLDRPGFYALNKSPGSRKFIKENGVDLYTRHHIEQLVFRRAEVITRDELLAMYKVQASNELKILLQMTRRRKRSK